MVQGIQLNIIRDGGCAICKNFIKSARNVTLTLNLSLILALTLTTTAIMHCVLIMDAEGILEGGGRPGFGRWSNFYVAAGSPLSSTRGTPHSHWLKDAKSLSNGFRISFDSRHGPKLIRFRISLCLFLRRLLCRPARRHAPPPSGPQGRRGISSRHRRWRRCGRSTTRTRGSPHPSPRRASPATAATGPRHGTPSG